MARRVAQLSTDELPGAGDDETKFGPRRAFVRRVSGRDFWIRYRFDDDHVYAMTARGQPPVPDERSSRSEQAG